MIEQVEKRTRNSKTFLRSDGKFELRSRSAPIHFISNGQWEDIDNRVITSQAQGYYLENGLNEFKVYFKQNLNSKP